MRRISEATERIESLPNSRAQFFGTLEELENDYKDLMRIDQQHIREAQTSLDRAKEDLKKVEERSVQVSGIRAELNALRTLVIESGEIKKVSEDQEI